MKMSNLVFVILIFRKHPNYQCVVFVPFLQFSRFKCIPFLDASLLVVEV